MQKLKDRLKNSNILSKIYSRVMWVIFYLLDVSLIKKKKIIFSSFSGRQYSDSPKILSEAIQHDPYFEKFEIIWAFNKPETIEVPKGIRKVNINSIKFLLELFSSKVWISNASIEKLVPYNSKKILYINSWHGIPIKKIGKDEDNASFLIKNWYEKVEFDYLLTCSDYDEKIFKKIFPRTKNYLRIGLPRNKYIEDSIIKHMNFKKQLTEKLEIHEKSRLLLYAPTFRDQGSSVSNPTWSDLTKYVFPKNTYLIIRTHYFETVELEKENPHVFNLSNYNLDDLLMGVDALITDYSSLMFDFYKTNKPIYLFPFDYMEYYLNRGLYLDYKNKLNWPILENIDEFFGIVVKDNPEKSINPVMEKYSFVKTDNSNIVIDLIKTYLDDDKEDSDYED